MGIIKVTGNFGTATGKHFFLPGLFFESRANHPFVAQDKSVTLVDVRYVFLDIYDDGRLFWVTREYYWDSALEMRQKTDAEYADDLAQFIGPHVGAKVIIDPSAASFKAEMVKRGIWHVDADNEVNEGVRIASMVLNQRMVRFCRQGAPKTI